MILSREKESRIYSQAKGDVVKILSINKVYEKLLEIESYLNFKEVEFLDIDQASSLLKVKKSYLYQLVHKKEVPYYKPNGKKIYFNRVELNKWISESKINSVSEIENFGNASPSNKNNRFCQGK